MRNSRGMATVGYTDSETPSQDVEISMVTEVVEAEEEGTLSNASLAPISQCASVESDEPSNKNNGEESQAMVQIRSDEPPEMFLEVVEESSAVTPPTNETPEDLGTSQLDEINETDQPDMEDEEDSMIATTEYAISQVISGDTPHTSCETSGTLTSSKVQSASVTLFDPAQRESIIQYANQTSISQASRKFKVPVITIRKWMNSMEDSAVVSKSKFSSPGQGRKLSYSQEIDDRIASHIQDLIAKGERVPLQYVCTYAKTLIREEKPNFVASSGWAQRFLVRHAIELNAQKSVKKKPGLSPESCRGRPLSYSTVTDKAIAEHVKSMLADGQQVTNSELRKYAKDMISKENPSFTGSASWAQNFLLRHKIALQSFPSNTSFSLNSPTSSSSELAQSMLSSTSSPSSPPLSDPSLIAAEITPAPGSSGPIYSDASIGSMETVAEDPMKTALTLLTGENIDLTMLSTAQVAALQNSLSELTADAVSLVDLLNNSTGSSTSGSSHHQRPDGAESTDGEDQNQALITSGLESPTSGNVYLNLGSGESFGSGLIGMVSSHSTPSTTTTTTTTICEEASATSSSSATLTSGGFTTEVVAQGSRPLSYAVETDQALASWVHFQQALGKRVTFASLRAYAKQLIANENPNFNASVGWVTPFLLRHNLDLSVNRKAKATRSEFPHRGLLPQKERQSEQHLSTGEQQSTSGQEKKSQLELSATRTESLADHESLQPPPMDASIPEIQASLENSVLEHTPMSETSTALTPPEAILPEQLCGSDLESDKQSKTLPENPEPSLMLIDSIRTAGKEQEDGEKGIKKARNEKTRTRHTLAEKLEVVQLMKEYGVAAHYVCRTLGIANSTFAGWTKLVQQKGAELQALSANKKRANVSGQGRPLSYPRDKDEQIAHWVKERLQMGLSVSPSDLSKQATYVISQENPNFTASSGWQQKFLQRHNIQLSNSWIQKPPGSQGGTSGSPQGEESRTSISSPVLEDAQNIPTAVQTEEVSSNEFVAMDTGKSYAYSDYLDEQLVQWVKQRQTDKDNITVQMLLKKAEDVICKEVSKFVPTLGWAFKFLHRHSLMLSKNRCASSSSMGVVDNSRKRPVSESSDSMSRYLHTPKKVRQMDQVPVATTNSSSTPPSILTAPDLTLSPNTGNLCEALLVLSNQAMAEGEPALQAAMQNLQNAMQQALKQQQLHLLQQQQQQKKNEDQKRTLQEASADQPTVHVADGLSEEQTRQHAASSAPGNIAVSSSCPPFSSTSNTPTTMKVYSNSVPPTERITPYNNYFGKPAREFSAEEKEEVVRYANATTLLKAALKYGVAAPTVWRWRVELKLHQPKYTSMQKKYIIKFAETNSLKEASHRYGITSKTIQNWRKALQSDGDSMTLSGTGSEEVLPVVSSHAADQMLETSPLSKVSTTHDSEVVAYDSHNFQFIVDGGEVTDISSRGDHDIGGRERTPTTSLRVDPVPLEVTNEVDIENVGMEYDVISSEGHAAKPRCTAEEKMQILQYAIEHSVREASQKYGISPGTLYYWKKSNYGGSYPGVVLPVGEGSAVSSRDDSSIAMSVYPGSSSILEQIQVASGSSVGSGQPGKAADKVRTEQYFASDADVVSSHLSGNEVSLLHAVSSFLNPADSSIVTSSHADPSQSAMAQSSSSISGGISSPTEVLVAPLQVASEEVATVVEEVGESEVVASSSPPPSPSLVKQDDSSGAVESVVVVEVERQKNRDQDSLMHIEVDKDILEEVKDSHNIAVDEEVQPEIRAEEV